MLLCPKVELFPLCCIGDFFRFLSTLSENVFDILRTRSLHGSLPAYSHTVSCREVRFRCKMLRETMSGLTGNVLEVEGSERDPGLGTPLE